MKLTLIRNCPMCGDEFRPYSRNQIYCSNRCYDMHAATKELYHHTERNVPVRHLTCPNCGKDIFTRKKQVKFCCDECKHEFQNRKAKKTYTCVICGKEFTDAGGKYKYCSDECHRQFNILAQRKAYANGGKEKQKVYRNKNKDRVNEQHRNYIAQNRSYWNKKANESHKITRDLKKMERITKEQEQLMLNANLNPVDEEARNRWKELHIIRETVSVFTCMDCGKPFILTKNDGGIVHLLGERLKHGKGNPCPWCGDAPVNMHRYNTVEADLAEMYPNFSLRNYRPQWMEGLELDLYDPERRVALEFHGILWHSDYKNKERVVSKHKRKADLCEANGVQLIQVYETEWVQSRQQVIDKLDAIFHMNMERKFARKLSIRELNDTKGRKVANLFMDENHIQGHASSQWIVGLFDGDEPMAVCCFKYGTAYASGGQTEGTEKYWELNRYATKMHVSVVGGISRCVKAFERAHPEVKNIVSFADRRWTCPTRSAYSSSGFAETGRCEPNYQYTDLNPCHPLRNKQYMRKSSIESRAKANPEGPEAKVFSWDKTETEMSRELGYYRIYDAGKIRYEMKINQ